MAAVMKQDTRYRLDAAPSKLAEPSSAVEIIEDKRTSSHDSKTVVSVDKYAMGRLLGKGGFAKCFLATCMRTNTECALKIVQKSSLLKLKSRLKLQSEIKIHKSLSHEYVVRFDRFFEDHTCAYIKLELCSNNSMSELQKRRKRLTEPEARYYLTQLVIGMEYLHANLIIHRDLKLGNIFIGGDMCVKIGDFGLASKLAFPTERKRTVCGTPNYIAPEILEGKDGHSFEVDNWSIGVILYTMIVGRPPYECRDVKSTYKKILANSYSYPDLVPCSDGAKHLIQGILQTRPEKRLTLRQIQLHPYMSSGYTPTRLPLSAMVQPPDTCMAPILGKKGSSEVMVSDENDRHALNRVAGSGPAASNPVKTATKVIAEVNTNRSFRTRAGTVESNANAEGGERASTTASRARAASASHARPVTRSSKPEAVKVAANKKFTIYSDTHTHDNVASDAGTAPAQKWAWQHQENNKASSAKEQGPPLLPYEKDSKHAASNWTSEAPVVERPPSWRAAVPKAELAAAASAVVQPEILATASADTNDEVGLDKLDWEMDKMTLGNKSEKRESLPSAELGSRRDSGSHTTPAAAAARAPRLPRTLEAIHDTLSMRGAADGANPAPGPGAKGSSDIWVVRYMDYTSKYGLGFLLNNGCAGVYFNDSTKIILSADGLVFQYFERRNRTAASCTSEGDHMKTTHTLANHPPELVKKVTLLRHFRDYLLDRRTSDSPAVPEGKGNLVPVNPVPLPAALPGSVPWTSGARGADLESWADMPYLKKWVRTRHAVLLRLSNRCVQVSFFDTSELLLSAEANIVTYLDREGSRTHHILRDVMESGKTITVHLYYYNHCLVLMPHL
jgi:serine/threonine protein kinase